MQTPAAKRSKVDANDDDMSLTSEIREDRSVPIQAGRLIVTTRRFIGKFLLLWIVLAGTAQASSALSSQAAMLALRYYQALVFVTTNSSATMRELWVKDGTMRVSENGEPTNTVTGIANIMSMYDKHYFAENLGLNIESLQLIASAPHEILLLLVGSQLRRNGTKLPITESETMSVVLLGDECKIKELNIKRYLGQP